LFFLLQKTKLIDEKILSVVLTETANHPETLDLQVQEEALDTVVAEPKNQTKDGDLIRTEAQEEIFEIEKVGHKKDIPNIASEAVFEEYNTDNNLKGVDKHTENAAVSTCSIKVNINFIECPFLNIYQGLPYHFPIEDSARQVKNQ
jgi:hypothetical protein